MNNHQHVFGLDNDNHNHNNNNNIDHVHPSASDRPPKIKSQNQSNALSGFIFNFFVSPLTRLSNRLASAEPSPPTPTSTSSLTPTDNECSPSPDQEQPLLSNSHSMPELSPNHLLSQFFAQKGDAPLTQGEARRVMALLNDSNSPEQEKTGAHQLHQPGPSKPLPTVFMPSFPSLARAPVPSPSRPSTPLGARARPSTANRRTFYMGPGHSIMNSSTRLGLARRKRIGILRTSTSLPNGYDLLPAPQSVEPEPKRRRLDAQPQPQSAEPAPQPESAQTEAGPSGRAEHQNLRLPRTMAATPVRPSPLRHVTLPASTPSPAKRTPPRSALHATPGPKQAKKHTSSILSSVMKEVDAEMRTRTPAPSPVKPAEVINPYSGLERPRRREPLFGARPASSRAPPSKSAEEREARKRRIEVCLDGDTTGTGTEQPRVETAQKNNRTEQILEQTMPDEYRQKEGNEKPRQRTRQVGKLPDRLLKKQEQVKKRLAATGKGKAAVRGPEESDGSKAGPSHNKGPIDSPSVTVNFATGFKFGGSEANGIPTISKPSGMQAIPKPQSASDMLPVEPVPEKAPSPAVRPAGLTQPSAGLTTNSLVAPTNGASLSASPSGLGGGKSSAPSPPDAEERSRGPGGESRESGVLEAAATVAAKSAPVDLSLSSQQSGHASSEKEEEAAKEAALAIDAVALRDKFGNLFEGLFDLAGGGQDRIDGSEKEEDEEVRQVVMGFNESELPRFCVL